MRKLLTGVAVALVLALGAVSNAKAQEVGSGATMGTILGTPVSKVSGIGLMFALPTVAVCGIAANNGSDICKPIGIYLGAPGQKVEVTGGDEQPQTALVPRFTAISSNVAAIERAKSVHSFNVAMGYADDADTKRFLASASR